MSLSIVIPCLDEARVLRATLDSLAPARRRKLGITDGLVRLSIGIEDVEDVLADIEQALD